MAPVALLDANVLYPSLIRNLLMHCATSGLIAARWTAAIHDEWMRNLLADRPDLTSGRLERTRQQMEQAVPDAEVTEYEGKMVELDLPDPGDTHVLAAAIQAAAEYLVTFNLRDFPRDTLERYGIEAVTPDELLCGLFDAKPDETLAVIEQLRLSFHNPPYDVPRLHERLRTVGLPQLIARLEAR